MPSIGPGLQLAPVVRYGILPAIALLLGGYIFWTPLKVIVGIWTTSEEYNYGPLIPVLAAAMLARDLRRSTAGEGPGWIGFSLLLIGLVFGVFGKVAAFVYLAEIGIFFFLVGLFASVAGDARARSVWPGLLYLGFGIPLARLLQANLSAHLQLISSQIGAGTIRIFGIPVFLDGNIIDLGAIQLEVAAACSGLRYLFPLASFGFLCAYLYRGPAWQRVLILFSTVPITILLNSLRIGVTGILVDRFGIEAAQGFFHDFEGWLIFCGCVAILFLEIKILCLFGGDRALLRRLDFSWPPSAPKQPGRGTASKSAIAALLVVVATAAVFPMLKLPDATAPARAEFSHFPRNIDRWSGTDLAVDAVALDSLKPTDYLSVNFVDLAQKQAVALWVAYYSTQEIGEAIHSPRICIPAGGWRISEIRPVTVTLADEAGALTVNRAIIQKGNEKALVYYWFQGRGRIEANEFVVKLHLMGDAMLRQRTDGALVRLVTPILETEQVAASEQRLQSFLAELRPQLTPYLPD
ncbi:VPLPA-CTERM-specific exosortase XrtD [Dongia sedimenti]|uniref:VPLPA-CTERM-specific exosortase XrtD n=1 Tax=Dongia sedimenti TaxID=3064282 RepID=A0ABU0YR82_9PROT|nr:VPLPA-CTERM-specific exosortase XrtD [Rhodospirillaceae bacterium R-7]